MRAGVSSFRIGLGRDLSTAWHPGLCREPLVRAVRIACTPNTPRSAFGNDPGTIIARHVNGLCRSWQRWLRNRTIDRSGSGQFCRHRRMRYDPRMENQFDSSASLQERRRQIFRETADRYASKGIALDDPAYLEQIELWIAGAITMREAMAGWDAVLAARLLSRPTQMPRETRSHSAMTTAELLSEIETVTNGWSETSDIVVSR
jgi:hypothetical protein